MNNEIDLETKKTTTARPGLMSENNIEPGLKPIQFETRDEDGHFGKLKRLI